MSRYFLPLAACLLVTACASTPAPTPTEGAHAAQSAPATVSAVDAETQAMNQVLKTLASHSIYFDYNDFTIKPQYLQQLKQDYELLKSAPKLAVTLEGNADERGSREYNLALGQKRAEAVKRALISLGIPESQLEAVSYGAEKPRATCNEEKCWAENRRVDFARKTR